MQERPPIYRTLAEIASLWIAAEVGYRVLLPLWGFSISYNDEPTVIALYYALWLLISIIAFRDTFLKHIEAERLWINGMLSLGFFAVAVAALYGFAQLPIPDGKPLIPYTDILFASPWYFLPKAVEILVQQTLVAVLVFMLDAHFRSMRTISIAYAVIFGGAHVIMFALSGAPTPYATIMTIGSILSAAVFPFLVLRAKGGFVYAYAIHVAFYLALAIGLHTWPPPDYA